MLGIGNDPAVLGSVSTPTPKSGIHNNHNPKEVENDQHNTALTVLFSFENHSVRTILVDNEPWFVVQDIMNALEYAASSNPSRVIGHIPSEWVSVKPIHTNKGNRPASLISEQGLYFFLGRSDKPKALPFQKWLAGEVLPSIRKTGSYSLPKKQLPEPPRIANIPFNLLRDADYLIMVRNGKATRRSISYCEVLEDRNAAWS